MGETRPRKTKLSPLELGRLVSGAVGAELAEIRQRQALAQKQNDMLDLLGHSYLGIGEALMNHRLPRGLPLVAVRGYIAADKDYAQLQRRSGKSGRLSGLADGQAQRQAHHQAQAVFLDGVGRKDGDNRDLRWQVVFNLAVMGVLRDADLTEGHRRLLDEVYVATQDMVDNHLPWLSRQMLFRAYPFIKPVGGQSPFGPA